MEVWIHFTEHMSPHIDGKGNDVLNIAKFFSNHRKNAQHVIISGKWNNNENNIEELDGILVIRDTWVYKINSLKIPLKFKIIITTMFISFLLFVRFLKSRDLLKLDNSTDVFVFGHHLWGGLTAAMASIICSRCKAYWVLYGTASAYGKIWDVLESITLKVIKSSFKKIFVLDNASKIVQKVLNTVSNDMTVVFPQAVSSNFLNVPKAKDIKRHKSTFSILVLSPHNPAKNLEQVLYAIYDCINSLGIPKHHLNCTFVGDGPLKDKLISLASELGISDVVKFVGRVPHFEVIKYLDGSDLLLATSKHNSNFERVVIEALSRKLPVLVTNTGRTAKYLFHLKTAIVVDNDPKKIARAIVWLMENPKFLKKIGANGYNLIKNKYTMQRRETIFVRSVLGGR